MKGSWIFYSKIITRRKMSQIKKTLFSLYPTKSYPPLISTKHFLDFIQNSLIEIWKKSKRLQYKSQLKHCEKGSEARRIEIFHQNPGFTGVTVDHHHMTQGLQEAKSL